MVGDEPLGWTKTPHGERMLKSVKEETVDLKEQWVNGMQAGRGISPHQQTPQDFMKLNSTPKPPTASHLDAQHAMSL